MTKLALSFVIVVLVLINFVQDKTIQNQQATMRAMMTNPACLAPAKEPRRFDYDITPREF
jgi:hypothetical protein